jgi:hypothetical protein
MSRTIQLHTGNQGLITLAISASYALTSSAATSITFTPLTASYALTAGAAGGGVVGSGTSGKFTIWNGASSISASSLIDAGTSITSSVPITGSISNAITASFATTASYAATSSNLIGGVANYIPLWGSTTLLSSSTIYQSTGNIGIGTLSPSAKLHVSGNAQVMNLVGADHAYIGWYPDGISAGRKGYLGYPGASTDNFTIGNEIASGHIILTTNGGNVGIGTTTPAEKLDVYGAISIGGNIFASASSTYNFLYRRDGGVGIYLGGADPANYYDNNAHYFRDRSSNIKMYINSSTGDVGIGTISPSNKLQVQGNVSASSYTSSISNGVGYFGTSSFAVSASWAPSAVVSTYTNATDNRVLTSTGAGGINGESTLTYNGTVLSISTNGARYFQGGDDAALYDVDVANTLGVYGVQNTTVGAIKLGSSGQTLYSNATGLGIGTTTPGATLHIQGNVSASSYTSSLGFLVTGSTGYRHTSGSVGAVLRANPTTNAVEFGAETNHVVNMTINNTPTYQFGAGAFIPIFAAYNLGALINPWDKVFANNIFSSGSIVHTGSMQIVSGTLAVQSIFEKVTVTSSAPPATLNYNILDQAILFHSASSTANWTLNFRGNASTTLNSIMYTGQSLTTTLMVLNAATAYSASAYQIDGTTIRPRWQGGTSGSANTNSLDAHTFTIIKTSATPTYVLLGSITKYT